MVYLLWWIFISTGVFCSDLFSVDIYRSTVYTSSVEPGSQPRFAVDNDLLEEKPTCFQTNNDQPDADGQHWILIDFGYVLSNIKEIRVVTETGYNLSNLSAYTMRKPNLTLQQLVNLSRERPALHFHTPDAVLCSSTGPVESWRTAATIQCDRARDGRWLAIRQAGGMHVCMVNVYVTQAYAMCFDQLPTNEVKTWLASVFRLIRHLTLGACRAACMGSPECTGLVYAPRSRSSGNCHLMRPALGAISDDKDGDELVEERFDSVCRHSLCVFEVNRCHEGHRFDLEKRSGEGNSAVGLTHQLVDVNLEQTQDWLISQWNSTFYENERNPRYLVSVHLRGYLNCNSWNCGSLRVTALQADGYETVCATTDTVKIHVLDSFPILCGSYGHHFPVNISTVRLIWKAWHKSGTGKIVKFDVDVLGGHVRISNRLPPIKKQTSSTTPATSNDSKVVTKPQADANSSEMNDDEYTMEPAQPDQQLFNSLQPVSKTTQIPDPTTDNSSVSNPPTPVYRTIDSIQLNGSERLVNDDDGYETGEHNLYRESIPKLERDTKVYGKRGLMRKNDSKPLTGSSFSVPSAVGRGNSLVYSFVSVFNAMLVLIVTFVDIFY